MKAFVFIIEILRNFTSLISLSSILVILMCLIDAVSIFSLAPVVDILIHSKPSQYSGISKQAIALVQSTGLQISLSSLLAVFLFFNILRSAFGILSRYYILKTKYAFLKKILLDTFESFFNAKWYFFSSTNQGTLLNTFNREINLVGDSFGAISQFFANIIQFMLYVTVPFVISWQLTGISIFTAILFIAPFFLLGKTSRRLGQLNTKTANILSGVINECFLSAKIILGFGNQGKSLSLLSEAYDEHSSVSIKSQLLGQSVSLMYYPLGITVLAISTFVGKKLSIPVAELTVILYAFIKILPAIGQLTTGKNALENFFPSYEQVLRIKEKADELVQPSGEKTFEEFETGIQLKDVSFSFPGTPRILKNITIKIPKGKTIAVVGHSGSGKSTLVDMIMGFNNPTNGEITIDDEPLQHFEMNSYRSRIGYVPQESMLFNTTIRDNLLWAKESASSGEIEAACRKANAHDFIEQFPQKYDTVVGDRGVRISGGQLQRIALARALLRKPALLILDEATSSLDSFSERLIQKALEEIPDETTTIIIAHRLSTIKNSDYIYVIDKGAVVEMGTFDALIQKQRSRFGAAAKLQGIHNVDQDVPIKS